MRQEMALSIQNSKEQASEARLISLVLDTVTSEHSRRSYRTGLVRFFTWIRTSDSAPSFSKALVGEYRAHLLEQGLSAATVNLRLAPVRRLAREMADNGLLDSAVAAAVGRVTFRKDQRVTHAAVVENKRLGHALAIVKAQQDRKLEAKVLTNSEKTGYKKRPRQVYGPDYIESERAPAAVEMWKLPKNGDYTHPHRTTTAGLL